MADAPAKLPAAPGDRPDAAPYTAPTVEALAGAMLDAPADAPPALAPPDAASRETAARLHAPLVLGVAAALGGAAELLLRAGAPGVNVPLTVGALLAAVAWLARRTGRGLSAGAVLLALAAALFAGLVAWRDAAMLVLLDLAAAGTALAAFAAAVWHGDAFPLDRAGPGDYVAGAWRTSLAGLTGTPQLVRATLDAPRPARRAALGARTGTIARGTALALPVLLLFGALLTAADGTFARLLGRLVSWDVDVLVSHVALAGVLAWPIGGLLWRALLAPPATAPDAARARSAVGGAIGAGEVCVALALVDALFLAFGVLQLGWLFGGEAALARAGVTVAEYARRGFFELVAVAALALPLLVGAHAAVAAAPEGTRARRAFRLAAGALVALVLVLLASALDRMRLYRDAFGLTEARFYATALLAWLGVVFAWAAATLLRGRTAPFALGTLLSAWGGVLLLNVTNPAARVVTTNVGRAAAGRAFDVAYLIGLGADAVPTLVQRALPAVTARGDADAACDVARMVRATAEASPTDWRSAHVGRARAAAAAHAHRAALEAALAGCPAPVAAPPAAVGPSATPPDAAASTSG